MISSWRIGRHSGRADRPGGTAHDPRCPRWGGNAPGPAWTGGGPQAGDYGRCGDVEWVPATDAERCRSVSRRGWPYNAARQVPTGSRPSRLSDDAQDFIAFSGTTATPLMVTWQDPPTQALALNAGAQSAPSGRAFTVSATVTDANGQPVAGQPVTFRLNGPTTATLGAAQATTNARGMATTTATNSAPWEAVVTASTDYDTLAQVAGVAWATPTYALTLPITVGGNASAAPAPYDAGTPVTITATVNAS